MNNVNSIADRLLQGAFATRDELLNQRQYLNNAQLQVLSTMQNIPGLNVLISKINTRRKRDTLIFSVIAICILFYSLCKKKKGGRRRSKSVTDI